MSFFRAMNIIYVGTLLPHHGGAGNTAALLLTGLAQLGHRVRAIAPITAGAALHPDPMQAWCPEISVSRYEVPYDETDSVGSPASQEYRNDERRQIRRHLLSLAAAEPADIILVGRETFVHEIPGLADRLRRPWVLRLGGHMLMGMAEGHFSPTDVSRIQQCFHAADLVLAQAEHVRPWAERFGCHRIAIVPNLVDVQQFAPRPKPPELCRALGVAPDDVVVMHLSNLKPVKRTADIVESAPATLARNPRVLYVIVGDGPCRPDLERMAAERQVQSRFRFTGWVDYARVPDYLALADIVVMPSEREQQARVYLETQASGRVLIASGIPGSRCVIEHGRSGLLFRMGDPRSLHAQVSKAAADATLRARIGRQARRRIGQHAVATVCSLLAATMEDVIQRHGARSPRHSANRRARLFPGTADASPGHSGTDCGVSSAALSPASPRSTAWDTSVTSPSRKIR